MTDAIQWVAGTYLRNGKGLTLKFDPAIHDGAQLKSDGFFAYDPMAPGDDSCTDTHAWITILPCMHEETWWCPMAPHAFWYPNARGPQWRDRDYVKTHHDGWDAQNPLGGTNGPSADDDARLVAYKTQRIIGISWREIFERLDTKAH